MSRSSIDIGQGLAAARHARPIRPGERIHVLGVAGAGASAAAILGSAAGAKISGCDPGGPSPYSPAVDAAGITVEWRHAAEHVADGSGARVDRLAVTKALTAVQPDHPELLAARSAGIPAEPWQQTVADAAVTGGQRLVAVAGTHGKSTTTGWLVHLLVTAGRDPSAFVGALLSGELTGALPATARWGRGDAFVVEADEYAGNFDPYRPDVAVLLNAEWDHPDVFADEAAVLDAFEGWLRRAADDGRRPVLVANVGDEGVRRVVERLAGWPGEILAVGIGDGVSPSWDATARHELGPDGASTLRLHRRTAGPLNLPIGLGGRHNAANAMAVIGVAAVLGVPDAALIESLATFGGVGRRLELKGDVASVTVLDDYAHHPTAIARTLEAVRQRYPHRRLWAVYEPLTYHRTALMLDRFADVLSEADAVAIADIWAGRDPDTTIISSTALADAVSARGHAGAAATGSPEETASYLAERVTPGDVVLVMGGGRSYVIADTLVRVLKDEGVDTGLGPPAR